jgi:Na+-transporting NADH:ubiquinone oxidoreductase subunit C
VEQPKKPDSTNTTILFMVILSFICAVILGVLASALAEPKEVAKDLDRSKQMMIAAKILTHEGNFIIANAEGEYGPARYTKGGALEPTTEIVIPTQDQLLEVYRTRLEPLLVNKQGNVKTFAEAKLDENSYTNEYRKAGYYTQPEMLIYKILPNPGEGDAKEKKEATAIGYVIPVNGFGLWDAIYGYLAIKTDGNTVIGITWYDQKETPGLGANIADPPWQSLFPGKKIFQAGASGETDFKTAPLGIVVVRGKVSEVLGSSPKAISAVDGMSGATLTGNGVIKAYQDVLAPYRPFLIKLHDSSKEAAPNTAKEG